MKLKCVMGLILGALMLCASPVLAGETPDGFIYEISNGSAIISHYTGTATQVEIPAMLEGYPVTRIGSYAFYNKPITSVKLPEGIVELGSSAFQDCSSLSSINFPSSLKIINLAAFTNNGFAAIDIPGTVQEVAPQAFARCKNLVSATLRAGVKKLGDNAFSDCTKLANVTLPNGITEWGTYIFANTSLTNVAFLPADLTYIPSGMFRETKITSFVLPQNIKEIREYAFSKNDIKELIIPEGVTKLGNRAFESCHLMTKVQLPNSLVDIVGCIFADCRSLNEIVLPETLTEIPEAFYAESGIGSVILPDRITKVGSSAFWNCPNLGMVKLNKATELGENVFANSRIPYIDLSNVKKFGDSIFYGSKLEEVLLPTDMKEIPTRMFFGCASLKTIDLPSGIQKIGSDAFYGAGLTAVRFPQGLLSIGNGAFANCAAITTVALPSGLIDLGSNAFQNTGLTSIELPRRITEVPRGLVSGCSALTSVKLHEGISKIGVGAFKECAIASIEIPSKLTSIGSECFSGCAALKSIKLPSGVDEIPYYAFSATSSLTEIDLTGIRKIGNNAFAHSGLKKVDLNARMELVDMGAFNNCKSLEEAVVAGRELGDGIFQDCTALSKVTLAKGLTIIPGYCFRGCSSLTRVTIPDTVTTIGSDAFGECQRLTRVDIPASVTTFYGTVFNASPNVVLYVHNNSSALAYAKSHNIDYVLVGDEAFGYELVNGQAVITGYNGTDTRLTIPIELDGYKVVGIGNSAFSGNRSIEEVTLGANITSIGSAAFMGCTSLKTVVVPVTVTSIGANAFSQCPVQLIVAPNSEAERYARANGIAYEVDQKPTPDPGEEPDGPIRITGQQVATAGTKVKLTAQVMAADVANKKITWTSSIPKLAPVNKKGVVTLKKKAGGQLVTITATIKATGASATFDIVVLPRATKVLIIAPDRLEIDWTNGETSITLTAVVTPQDAAQSIKWKSANPKIATVDSNGVVTAHKAGKAKITAIATDGSKKTASCQVVVK